MDHHPPLRRRRLTVSGPSRRPRMFRYIAIIILVFIILVCIAVLITWLVVMPKRLKYSVEDAATHNFNITDANYLHANFDFTIRAYNPNHKVSIYYDTVEVSVRYEGQTLATNAVHPFFQSHKNVTSLQVRLTAQTVALYGTVPKDLRLEKTSGDIELDVLVRARIRFKVGKWESQHRHMRILCSPVLVHFSRDKSFGRTPCHVKQKL